MFNTTAAGHVLRVENSVEYRPILHCALKRIPVHKIKVLLCYFVASCVVGAGRLAPSVSINCIGWRADDPVSFNCNGNSVMRKHTVDKLVLPYGLAQSFFANLLASQLSSWIGLRRLRGMCLSRCPRTYLKWARIGSSLIISRITANFILPYSVLKLM